MIGNRRSFLQNALAASALLSVPPLAPAWSRGIIDVTDPPYGAGDSKSPQYNRDAIAQAIADAPNGSTVQIGGPVVVAPGSDSYIKINKPLVLQGTGWNSNILPDPKTPSTLPVIYVLGTPSGMLFHVSIRNLKIGDIQSKDTPREGGHAILVEANRRYGGTENCEIVQVNTDAGKYGADSYGIYLLHSNSADYGRIYNFTIERCQIMGAIKMVRVADSVRVLNNLIWGPNTIDIDVMPSVGNFTFVQNNASNLGGFRLRSGWAPFISGNVFTQQGISTEPNNSVVDLDGDLDVLRGVTMIGNYIGKEITVGQSKLLRVNEVASLTLLGGEINNPLGDVPVELTDKSTGVSVGPLDWRLPNEQARWLNRNPHSAVHEF
jgi:hypothetical protein